MRFVQEAIIAASNSEFQSGKKHGAVITINHKILGIGWNTRRPYNSNFAVHAEINAIRHSFKCSLRGSLFCRPKKKSNAHLYIVRLKENDMLGFSRPCSSCSKTLLKFGVKYVTYSTGINNEIVTENILDIIDNPIPPKFNRIPEYPYIYVK